MNPVNGLIYLVCLGSYFKTYFLPLVASISSSNSPLLLPKLLNREIKMKFIMEFAENLILRLMEDPKERDNRFREHMYGVKDRCNKTKEMWSYPIRPYGFWTFDRHNAQLAWDPQISQADGRRDPYDDVIQKTYNDSK